MFWFRDLPSCFDYEESLEFDVENIILGGFYRKDLIDTLSVWKNFSLEIEVEKKRT